MKEDDPREGGGSDGRDFGDADWRDDEKDTFDDGDFFTDEDEDEEPYEPPAYRKWIARTAAVLLVLALAGNVLAFWPKLYNLQVIDFLRTTRELSQDEAVQTYKQAIVVVQSGERKGTGFNIDGRGLIVTNRHVVADQAAAVVGFPDGRTFRAQVTARDDDMDIAVLRIDRAPEQHLPTLALETTATWTEGSAVLYIGNPLFYNNIVGEGKILGLASVSGSLHPVMVIDAPIYSGNSGSPVITRDGKVIAVIYATANMTWNGEREKVGLAVPLHYYSDSSLFDYDAR